ncbi:MAG: hypothetical protein K0R65_148 [Crocinitomicaceae bacterium]|nr:hypothetical protein [Crocinitomicaceae bacterium]
MKPGKTEKEIYSDKRANDILEVILSYARLEFDKKTELTGTEDVFDAISAGVNMLGEELENSTISLKEKEQLLQEVHHRVKNNLQIISSLLNLQSESVQDAKFLGLIRESKNRITSMALIHEMLYATKDLSHINFKEYVEKLYRSIYHTFETSDYKIDFEFIMEKEQHFEMDTMIPLGLIFNEIITNSFKYAFPGHQGEIKVQVDKKGEDLSIRIWDNGVGIPADFDHQSSKSLGIQLIHLLAEQIEAGLSVDCTHGTSYELHFCRSKVLA